MRRAGVKTPRFPSNRVWSSTTWGFSWSWNRQIFHSTCDSIDYIHMVISLRASPLKMPMFGTYLAWSGKGQPCWCWQQWWVYSSVWCDVIFVLSPAIFSPFLIPIFISIFRISSRFRFLLPIFLSTIFAIISTFFSRIKCCALEFPAVDVDVWGPLPLWAVWWVHQIQCHSSSAV